MIPRSPACGQAARRALRADRRGIAAVEFALVVPVILTMFGGAATVGLGVWARGALADAVAQGAYYAAITGPSVTPSAVQSVVRTASTLSGITATVSQPASECASASGSTVRLTTAPAPTGTPAVSTCPDGTTAGVYTTITASYMPVSILPAFTGLGAATITESATVRLR
jgi:Flp pilus assembly protein TadG